MVHSVVGSALRGGEIGGTLKALEVAAFRQMFLQPAGENKMRSKIFVRSPDYGNVVKELPSRNPLISAVRRREISGRLQYGNPLYWALRSILETLHSDSDNDGCH